MARTTFPALGTTATIAVTDADALPRAERAVRQILSAVDDACSRFRPDSELSRLHRDAGRATKVSALLAQALTVALRAAELTDGLVTPTVGAALEALGYDRDFTEVAPGSADPVGTPVRAAPWWTLRVDAETQQVIVPRGVLVDLGATAKALAADLAAARAADTAGCGVLVSLGGDLATAGAAPDDGWRIGVGDDHTVADTAPDTAVTVESGAMATSSVTGRRWRRGDRTVHHIVDPRTGDAVDAYWRTVSVAAGSCVDANTASTAAVILGAGAVDWLARRRLPARLVAVSGERVTVAGWPGEAS